MNEINDIKNMSFEDFEKISKKTFKKKLKNNFLKILKFPSAIFRIPKLPRINWKMPLKKICKFANVVILVLVFMGVIAYFSINALGFRTNAFVEKISYKNYDHNNPNFGFRYPDYYEIDNGENQNYGENYIIGLKLKDDSKIGCDIRLSKKGINFNKRDEEINNALAQETSKSTKDFQLKGYERIKVDGNDAFSQEFIFTDSMGNKTLVNQVMTGHDKNFYIFICGTGEYQYKFFEKDFNDFLGSFKWK